MLFKVYVLTITDFLFAKCWGPQRYFKYTILNTKWAFCASMRKKKTKTKTKTSKQTKTETN